MIFVTLKIFLLFVIFHSIFSFRLNVPKVLLPYYSSVPVNFTLEISDPTSFGGGSGCFKWKSSRPEIVTVYAENSCSEKALVSAVSRHRQKLTAVVFAEESLSGLMLRCDVMVDVIDEIEIVTTTRELFLEDAPEMFLVRAKNDQDDTFSSLDGMEFEWALKQNEEKVLNFVPFSQSKYETTNAILKLEEYGRRGCQILVEGVETGRATLSVRLKDVVYEDVPSHEINLSVVAHFMLNPSADIYMPIGHSVTYQVQLIKQGRVDVVPMPSSQYYLSLSDNDVCRLDVDSSVVTSITTGTTEISLKAKNLDLAATVRMPSAFIRVVEPASLSFVVYPGNNWILEVNRTYEIYLRLYDLDKHEIFVAHDMKFKVVLPEDHLTIVASRNNSYFVVTPMKIGEIELIGEFQSLKTRQKAEIFDRLRVEPELLVFPYDPRGNTYQYSLELRGGSGAALWSSDNRRVATVSENLGTVYAGSERGSATITATDVRNRLHQAKSKVVVVDVSGFEIDDGPREVELGGTVALPILAFADVRLSPIRRVPVTDCRFLKFDVQFTEPDVFQLAEGTNFLNIYGGCTVIGLKAKKVGDTEVIVVLHRPESTPVQTRLSFSVFNPLKVLDPENGLLLAPGSSWRVKYTGGPRPWLLDVSGYFVTALAADKNSPSAVQMIDLPSKSDSLLNTISIFIAVCRDYVETDILLSVGNNRTKFNSFPVVSTTKISIVCALPYRLTLTPFLPPSRPGFPSCPLIGHTSSGRPFPIHFRTHNELILTAFDKNNRKFDNISSLSPNWKSSDTSLLEIASKLTFLETKQTISDEKTILQAFVNVRPLGKRGDASVNVEFVAFFDYCNEKICLKSLKPRRNSLSTSADLNLIDYATLNPNPITIFNHPSNVGRVTIVDGSGYFHAPITTDADKSIASIGLLDSKMEITPKNRGDLILNVYDLCMNVDSPAVCHVFVANIETVKLIGPQLVQLNDEIYVNITLLDQNGSPIFGDSVLRLVDVEFNVDSSVIAVRLLNGGRTCSVTGAKVGTGSFTVTIKQKNEPKIVRSNVHSVQVYSSLDLQPKRVTLIVGAKFQLQIIGGPQTAGVLTFTVNDTSIASVRDDGLIEATKLGRALIVGRIVGSRGGAGVSSPVEELSEQTVLLDVVSLTGVKLRVPTKSIYVDSQITVHVTGLAPDNTPMSWGSVAEFPLTIEWTLDDENVADLGFVHDVVGLGEPSWNQFARRLRTKKIGVVNLKVKVRPHSKHSRQHHFFGGGVNLNSYSNSIQIRVLEPLRLVHPKNVAAGDFLIVTPNTIMPLKFNNNGHVVRYEFSENLINVNDDGVLHTFHRTGLATVIVTLAGRVSDANETLVLQVLVQPVYFIQFNVLTEFRTTEDVQHLPVGYVMEYVVSAHDSFGRTFHATNLQLEYRPTRFDLIDVVSTSDFNRSLAVHLKQPGETIIKIWDINNKRLVDYLRLVAGLTIKPNVGTITVGDFLCFRSTIKDSIRKSFWTSSKPNVVEISSSDGVALAKSSSELSTTTIFHSSSSKTTTKVDVNVIEPKKLEILTWKSTKYVTYAVEPVEIPFLVKGATNQTTNVHGDNCLEKMKSLSDDDVGWFVNPPFSCRLSFDNAAEPNSPNVNELLSGTAKFSFQTSSYACVLTPKTLTDAQILSLSRFESTLVVEISYSVAIKLTTDVVRIPYYAPFYVYDGKNDLRLDNLQNSVVFLSVGASQTQENYLKVTTNFDKFLKISEATKQPDGLLQYSVEFTTSAAETDELWRRDLSDVFLTISSELTKQETRLPLKIQLFGQPPKASTKPQTMWGLLEMLAELYGSAFLVLATIGITVAALFFGYRFLVSDVNFSNVVADQSKLSPNPLSSSFIRWKSYDDSRRSGVPSPSAVQYPYLWSLNRSQTPPTSVNGFR